MKIPPKFKDVPLDRIIDVTYDKKEEFICNVTKHLWIQKYASYQDVLICYNCGKTRNGFG